MDRLWDPLRRKEVAATPEEQVRQWFIAEVLVKTAAVPAHLMMSETGFQWGSKKYRADVLVYDRSARPLAVVECKRPDVPLSAEVAAQAMRYNAVLDVRWIFLTNGGSTLAFRREDGQFRPFTRIPSYAQMLGE